MNKLTTIGGSKVSAKPTAEELMSIHKNLTEEEANLLLKHPQDITEETNELLMSAIAKTSEERKVA